MLTKQDLSAIAEILDTRLDVRLKDTEKKFDTRLNGRLEETEKKMEKMMEEISERVSERVSKRVSKQVSKDTVYEFWETVMVPYLDRDHAEIMDKFQNLDEHIRDHEKRITRLETAVNP